MFAPAAACPVLAAARAVASRVGPTLSRGLGGDTTQRVWEEHIRTCVYILLPTDKKEMKLYAYLIQILYLIFDSRSCIILYISTYTPDARLNWFTDRASRFQRCGSRQSRAVTVMWVSWWQGSGLEPRIPRGPSVVTGRQTGDWQLLAWLMRSKMRYCSIQDN